ncbi:MAG: sulfotransferase [Pseudomonadota bacterium]
MSIKGQDLFEKGIAHEKAGNTQSAFEAFRQAAKANSRVAAPLVGLARLLKFNQQLPEAIACLKRAATCEPNNSSVRLLLADGLTRDGQLEAALHHLAKAISLSPDRHEPYLKLGEIYEDMGKRQAAAESYAQALERDPHSAGAIAGLLAVAEGQQLKKVKRIATGIVHQGLDEASSHIGYALGKALSRSGEHEQAWDIWRQANTARQRQAGSFDRDQFDAQILKLTKIFSEAFFADRQAWGNPDARPVVIVGLPRSGTTLTERIIGAHSQVFGAGELPDLADLASGTPDRLGRADPPWPDAAKELTETHAFNIGGEYAQRLAARIPAELSAQVSHIVDKQPLNFWHLGLLALASPNARVINCYRDIRDNGLSIFAENFNLEQRWATEPDDIHHYWSRYRRLMDHWRQVSNLKILDVSYEDTVVDIEAQIRRLLNFLELPFEAQVTKFHESEAPVQTPSRWQVRSPVYASSVGRWQNYLGKLGALERAYEEPADETNAT